MAENKTKPTKVSPEQFIAAVEHPGKREEAQLLDALFRKVTGVDPVMWGPSIIGYGSYRYQYDSGHGGEICRVGFSPRKPKHSLYLLNCGKDMDEAPFAALRERLGKYSRGKGCLYVNKLADIDLGVLEEMIALSWKNSHERYPKE
ncbi:MAG TPA: DUF1801 domain-containing protein [Sphingomonadaceae bacterium]|nr:DUF1801 domain-containing protein [Sphingomonadaceae bacterium]